MAFGITQNASAALGRYPILLEGGTGGSGEDPYQVMLGFLLMGGGDGVAIGLHFEFRAKSHFDPIATL